MSVGELFQTLDLNQDGSLTRDELHEAVRRLRWGGPYIPLFAVLDFLTREAPLKEVDFVDCMNEIMADPDGPYGQVLLRSPVPGNSTNLESGTRGQEPGNSTNLESSTSGPEVDYTLPGEAPQESSGDGSPEPDQVEDTAALLKGILSSPVSEEYAALLAGLDSLDEPVDPERTALLVIDPQRSFTEGRWMQSIGPQAEQEVKPIRLAFRACAQTLQKIKGPEKIKGLVETMFSRCPFPPESYVWDDSVAAVLHPHQPYFVKPGNSILWPRTNGFSAWVDSLLARGKTRLVMGGCTLNSCVRVSAIEVQRRFADQGLQVMVDLSLCGGRTSNYIRSRDFGGLSSVESAVREMGAAGVRVVPRLVWT